MKIVPWAKIQLKRTGIACPQTFEAYFNGEEIGSLHLRHGVFTVGYVGSNKPNIMVYFAKPKGDGIFDFDEESRFLRESKKALAHYLNDKFDETYYQAMIENFKKDFTASF